MKYTITKEQAYKYVAKAERLKEWLDGNLIDRFKVDVANGGHFECCLNIKFGDYVAVRSRFTYKSHECQLIDRSGYPPYFFYSIATINNPTTLDCDMIIDSLSLDFEVVEVDGDIARIAKAIESVDIEKEKTISICDLEDRMQRAVDEHLVQLQERTDKGVKEILELRAKEEEKNKMKTKERKNKSIPELFFYGLCAAFVLAGILGANL